MTPEMIQAAVRQAYLAVSQPCKNLRRERVEPDNKPEGEDALRVEFCTARHDKPLDYRQVAIVNEPRRR